MTGFVSAPVQWFALALMAATSLPGPTSAKSGRISADDLRPHVEFLADDIMAGRAVGGPADVPVTEYIAARLAKAGVVPAGTEGWFQPVSIITRTPQAASLTMTRRGRNIVTPTLEIALMGAKDSVNRTDMPVFLLRDDVEPSYALPDLSGQLVLVARSAKGAGLGMERIAEARRLHQRLIDAGANAIIVIAESAPRLSDIFVALGTADKVLSGGRPMAEVEGAISQSSVVALMAAGGGDWDRLVQIMDTPDFAGRSLPLRASVHVESLVARLESRNVIGRVPGRKPGSEAVLLVAHWDHLGVCGNATDADRICNGAIDNATGVAALIEIGDRLAGTRNDRDIYLLATTAEELGFLGVEAFVANGPVPVGGIVAAYNLDTLGVTGADSPVAIIGPAGTGTRPLTEKVIRRARLMVATSDYGARFVERQDGWLLSLAGIPTLMVNSSFGVPEQTETYLAERYHRPADEYRPDLDLSGAAQDANLHVALIRAVASSGTFPSQP